MADIAGRDRFISRIRLGKPNTCLTCAAAPRSRGISSKTGVLFGQRFPIAWIASLLMVALGACSPGAIGEIAPTPIASSSATPPASTPTLSLPTVTMTPAALTGTPIPARTLAPTQSPTSFVSKTSTRTMPLVGWTAKHGAADSARANLNAQLRLPLHLLWEWQEKDNAPQSAAISNGLVFLLTRQGQFCILDAKTGLRKKCEFIWRDPKGSSTGQVALSDDVVLVSVLETYIKPGERYGSGRRQLAAFSLDGERLWQTTPVEDTGSEMIVPGSGLVVSTQRLDANNYGLIALDITRGAPRWSVSGFMGHGASDGMTLYTDDARARVLTAAELKSGQRIWQQPVDARHVLYAAGRVLAASDRTLQAREAKTGQLLWQTSFGVFPLTADDVGIAAAHHRIYLIPEPGATRHGFRSGVMALDAATGKERWSALTGGDRAAEHLAATADSLVVLAREYGTTIVEQLVVLNAESGAELTRVNLGQDLVTGLAVADDQVYVLGPTLRAYGPR